MDYFCTICEDKRSIFYDQIITAPQFNLNWKKDILVLIVKKDYPRYWEENKNVLKSFSDLLSFRNKLAHSIVDVSDEALARPIEEGVGFVDWNNGEPITELGFNEWIVKANMVSSCISDVKSLLPFKQKPLD